MPRGRLGLLLLILIALCGALLVVRAGSATSESPVAGTPMVVRVDRDVSHREVAMAQAGAAAADRWLRLAFGQTVSRRTRIRLARGSRCDNADHPSSLAWAQDDLVCIRAGRPSWRRFVSGRGLPAMDVVAHEVVHVAQGELGCTAHPRAHRFLWLTEGIAVYGAREAMVMAGYSPASATARWIRENGGDLPARPPLSAFEHRGGDPPPYQLWHRAVRELATRHGPASLRRFCAAVGRRVPWHTAFAGAFGESVGHFYARFERLRRGG